MASEGSNEIPGVENQELAAVASLVPELPNVRAAPADRFAQSVRALVERRAQAGWPNEGEADLAVFVLVDYPRQIGEACGGTPFADPIAQGTPLLGRLFFSSADASHGQFILMPTEASEILEWLEDRGLGGCPVVTVYPNAQEMVTRRVGMESAARREEIRNREPSATVDELVAALAHYHRSCVLTPIGCPEGVWEPEAAHKYIPGPHPERSIQNDLVRALNFWFRGIVRAESEDSTTIGRIDVRLLKKNAQGGLAYWAILELKVIKSFTHGTAGSGSTKVTESKNVEAIAKGVRQAASYRENRVAEHGMLEVYDLREDKAEDLTVRERVTEALQVYTPPPRIDVWKVFGRAEDARRAGFTGA